jgi:hypothetical protein
MRKLNQHRNIPPTLKHNGRLNNSVAPRRKPKGRNALKNGVFAEPLILPVKIGANLTQYIPL